MAKIWTVRAEEASACFASTSVYQPNCLHSSVGAASLQAETAVKLLCSPSKAQEGLSVSRCEESTNPSPVSNATTELCGIGVIRLRAFEPARLTQSASEVQSRESPIPTNSSQIQNLLEKVRKSLEQSSHAPLKPQTPLLRSNNHPPTRNDSRETERFQKRLRFICNSNNIEMHIDSFSAFAVVAV
ncbi:hypothetical protein ECG_08894 [Echinococcus granulosus]|uniref:Uncharacterized protein n=1 Tax=Echinococcus granulosus TaxID=6210 RepID=A0A068WYI1_ECHGR|nr:hypothetical protein ECG_08894 [Echinococcus granulosus]CDS24885.1 hypothetical protein EgrG_002050200 [Echinococcus granulosus]